MYHEVQAIFLSVWVFPNSKILPPPPPPPPPPPSLPLLVLPSYFTLHLLHDSAAVCLTFGRKIRLHHLSTTPQMTKPTLFPMIITSLNPFSHPTPFLTSFEGMRGVNEGLFSAPGFVCQAITDPADWLPLRSLLPLRGCVTEKALCTTTHKSSAIYVPSLHLWTMSIFVWNYVYSISKKCYLHTYMRNSKILLLTSV